MAIIKNVSDLHRLDLTTLVTITEIAKRTGHSGPNVTARAKNDPKFPRPLNTPGVPGQVFIWPEVEAFYKAFDAHRSARKAATADKLRARLAKLEAKAQAA